MNTAFHTITTLWVLSNLLQRGRTVQGKTLGHRIMWVVIKKKNGKNSWERDETLADKSNREGNVVQCLA